MTGVKVVKTQCYLTTGYAVNRNVSIEMKIIQGVISRTMSHANHLAKETLFATMLYGVKASTQEFDSCNIGSIPIRAVILLAVVKC
mgnify:CR=1 FL=1